jgi:hypothetical protein
MRNMAQNGELSVDEIIERVLVRNRDAPCTYS